VRRAGRPTLVYAGFAFALDHDPALAEGAVTEGLMGAPSFVGGDSGTSHLRLFLCDAQGAMLDSSTGPGAVDASGHFSDA
jgi:hypothetical protein